MVKRFWLSYDLGIDGDYDGMYTWLDGNEAVECGDSVASFELEIGTAEPAKAVSAALKKHKVALRRKDRVYLIWRRDSGAVTGRFIAGTRRRAPWSGYAVEASEETEDAAE